MRPSFLPCLLALLCSSCATRALGRIGQSLEECRKQYGESTQARPDVLTFKTGGLSLIITFYDNRADAIVYRKAETESTGDPVELSAAEVNQLLHENAVGRTWKQAATASTDPTWETDDGYLSARYSASKHYLVILTRDYAGRAEAAEKARQSFGLKTF